MSNYLVKFTNQREMIFPSATLNRARLIARQYAIKNNLFVSRVIVR